MKIVWAKETDEGIQRIFDFLVEKNPVAAAKSLQAIFDRADLLKDFPEMGHLMDDDSGRRELIVPFGAGAYVLRYYTGRDCLIVVRVWHSRELRK